MLIKTMKLFLFQNSYKGLQDAERLLNKDCCLICSYACLNKLYKIRLQQFT